jgi:hypothetical protein
MPAVAVAYYLGFALPAGRGWVPRSITRGSQLYFCCYLPSAYESIISLRNNIVGAFVYLKGIVNVMCY